MRQCPHYKIHRISLSHFGHISTVGRAFNYHIFNPLYILKEIMHEICCLNRSIMYILFERGILCGTDFNAALEIGDLALKSVAKQSVKGNCLAGDQISCIIYLLY